MPGMSKELRDFARQVFADKVEQKPCIDCGGVHARVCPRLQSKREVINADGVLVERDVTYWAPGVWENYGIIWPEDVYDDDDASSGN